MVGFGYIDSIYCCCVASAQIHHYHDSAPLQLRYKLFKPFSSFLCAVMSTMQRPFGWPLQLLQSFRSLIVIALLVIVDLVMCR